MGSGSVTITPDQAPAQSGPVTITPDQPSVWGVLTQPTDKTDAEYGTYRGAAGVAGATVKGLDDVARGTSGALKGLWDMAQPGQDTAEKTIEAVGGPGALPIYRTVKGLVTTGKQAAQVPGAIKDINASPDPTGHYLNAAQDTVSQAAGQAITALGTEGAARVLPQVPVGRIASTIGKTAKGVAEDIPVVRQAGKLAQYWKDSAPPATNPGAPLPETPPTEVSQASSLYRGVQPVQDPAAGLGQVRGSIARAFKDPGAPLPEHPGEFGGRGG